MRAKVVVSPQARTAADRIDVWWRANRSGSKGLFAREFRRALSLLAVAPSMGPRYDGTRPGLRRYFINRTGHHLYYTFDEATRLLQVVTVWNAISESGPDL